MIQDNDKYINILFAATSDQIPFAVTTALSVKDNLAPNYKLNIIYLYADIIKPIEDNLRKNYIEYSKYCLAKNGIDINYIDVTTLMNLFEGQNIGLWGKEVSYTHYMYLLAPIVLKDIDKIIYLDTDIIANTDLSEVYHTDLGNNLIAMGAPRGQEEMGDDVSNSGFVVINLSQWRNENTLETLLEFGRNLEPARFCDQYLLYKYFTKTHPDRLLLLDKRYNIFPQLFPELDIEEMKMLHFTGWKVCNPWWDINAKQRAGYLWWNYAKETPFYEMFLLRNITKNLNKYNKDLTEAINKVKNDYNNLSNINQELSVKIKNLDNKIKILDNKIINLNNKITALTDDKYSFIEKIFSVKNIGTHKVFCFCGIKIKIKLKRLVNRLEKSN